MMNCKYCNNTKQIPNVYIVGDLRQAEAMIVAECLKRIGYPKLWNLYQDPNFDIHRWAAAPIFDCSEEDVTKYQREVGKLSNHSGNYGAGPKVLVNKALKDGLKGINYQTAKRILEVRYSQLPGLKEWWKDVERKLRQTRSLTTCLGRRRLFFGRMDHTTYRDAYSYEPQSTVGDVCNIIFSRLWRKFNKIQAFLDDVLGGSIDIFQPKPLIQVHDEVVTRCPNIPEIIQFVVDSYKEASIIPLKINSDKELIIPIELKIGKNWKDTEEIKDE
jgi:DNA polymerase I-like protein with 3'-5' exonuclease and polymerase domains